MKVLIVSDSHRRNDNLLAVIKRTSPIDMLIHCGDVEGSEHIISEAARCPVVMVQGNNDFFSNLPKEQEVMIGSYKVWVTHGHHYYIAMNTETIKQEARSREVDIVMCGHSHKPLIDMGSDITLINPGSISYPRQENRRPSYIIMELDREGKVHYTLNYC